MTSDLLDPVVARGFADHGAFFTNCNLLSDILFNFVEARLVRPRACTTTYFHLRYIQRDRFIHTWSIGFPAMRGFSRSQINTRSDNFIKIHLQRCLSLCCLIIIRRRRSSWKKLQEVGFHLYKREHEKDRTIGNARADDRHEDRAKTGATGRRIGCSFYKWVHSIESSP